ncbi:succinate-semialdehyde dehydrogenase/glutarate-semialdehyde dehydrogenase [Sphingobium sp. B1D7B]|uniref:NAD-dependent succinate-semialdehyde dehydrogenase n=1 Tax=Sphingobium sp. B1D7B TaxID=2940578 RepID=UPI0022253B09|nr:NAD-dependent succinate-semialdehyde dehydrogenase [Sphingobium sp. B1D7B]MCW2406867.1 succinate-semialdehyde dehydrogenase/glutarate-semialdehyde dehydrogenase [Sphingobium sp. B1D7B]
MQLSINPATGEELARFEDHDATFIDTALDRAVAAQRSWRALEVVDRVALLRRIATVLRANLARYAQLIVFEVGKPVVEAEEEVEKCAKNCDFYAENAAAYLADEAVQSNATQSMISYDPLGVVLAIMPWNYPFWQFFRFAAPAFAAGNGAVLKHANNVPQCAEAIKEVLAAAGAPDGLAEVLLIPPGAVADLIADDRIAAVTLTGSTHVGTIVAAQAGQALKKQVLELGGSDPFIVLSDADIEQAAAMAVKARYINVGQSCVNAKRFIVEDSVADAFVEAFKRHVEALVVGDPFDRTTQIGPMARQNLRDELHRQVEATRGEGGVVVVGGTPVDRPGFYYAPTIIDHVTSTMTAAREETFGPVAAILRVPDVETAIRLANETEFGLGASLWTSDLARARTIVRRIDAGAVFVNGIVASDPRLPFGGVKRSGYGRELGIVGMREFTNIKTVWIGPAQA